MFPTKAGLYLALGVDTTIMVRIIGFYPYLEVKDGYVIDDYITKGKLTPIDEGMKFLIKQKPNDWQYSTLMLNENVNTSISSTEGIELDKEEQAWYESTYRDCKDAGCSDHSLITMVRSKFGLTLEQGIALINKMKNGD